MADTLTKKEAKGAAKFMDIIKIGDLAVASTKEAGRGMRDDDVESEGKCDEE